jgi:hypothetical protein
MEIKSLMVNVFLDCALTFATIKVLAKAITSHRYRAIRPTCKVSKRKLSNHTRGRARKCPQFGAQAGKTMPERGFLGRKVNIWPFKKRLMVLP